MQLSKHFEEDLFMNEENALSFIHNGFFICNFLEVQEITELSTQLNNVEIPNIHFYHSHGFLSPILKKKFDEIISQFLMPRLIRIGLNKDYKSLTGVYILKTANAETAMFIHADDSFIDESLRTPINIWVPLVDVSEDNGTICIVPGSHHHTKVFRGRTTKDDYINKHTSHIKSHYKPINLMAGQALVYHPGIVHFSPPNMSGNPRPVVAMALIPKEEKPQFFFEKRSLFGKPKVLVYDLDDDFFYKWDNKNPPKIKPSKIITLVS